MNPADPLAQLRDIHLPEPVNWWPPAPGWWVVLLLSLATVFFLVYYIRKYWLQRRYRRAALRELGNFSLHDNMDNQALLEEISVLLCRVALQAYGREKVAPLTGGGWLAFLDNTGKTEQFTMGAAKVLGAGLYQSSVEADMEQVLLIVRNWIKGHRK